MTPSTERPTTERLSTEARLDAELRALYGEARGPELHARLRSLMATWQPRLPAGARPAGRRRFSSGDSVLITYADQLRAPGEAPLRTLAGFCQEHLSGLVSAVHLLPFYPSSSDDGFSVMDYRAVDPAHGSWEDVAALGQRFELMFDAVVNHASAQGSWCRAFLAGERRYADFFRTATDDEDLSQVFRPRTSPLLTTFPSARGPLRLWTTFSADQVDLDLRNPAVLAEIVDVLLEYVAHGASLLRLDAIAFLWKRAGTTCLHLPETHGVIRVLRLILDEVAPHVALITETNVPHRENVSYFGDGHGEAQLVYNFALPPLVLHTLRTGRASELSSWAAGLELPSREVTFFNFLASHDGIGVTPVRDLLPAADVAALAAQVRAHGGEVSARSLPDGTESPYELNASFWDALNDPRASEPLDRQVARFSLAQAILLALRGVPALYFHSLVGSRGWPEGVARTGHKRTINREKLERGPLEQELSDPASRRAQVFSRLARLLRARASSSAFDPVGEQTVPALGDGVFALLRRAADGGPSALLLHEVSGAPHDVRLPELLDALGLPARGPAPRCFDLLDGGRPLDLAQPLGLSPYDVRWLVTAPPPRSVATDG
ncbi:MAG: sugar phosphorylase [Deltaproteobacteria bacterium]|nr:sugar phosphorylase [Deltaproteobacteria bacterium]